MRIFLHEITDQATELHFTDEDEWLRQCVTSLDEPPSATPKDRLIDVQLSMRKVDGVVVANGSVETSLELICSRCANPFTLPCDRSFSALFCKDPVMGGIAHTDSEGQLIGINKGFARHAHDKALGVEKDLDITYLAHDFIDIGEILVEQLQLQIPFQPLCRESCMGVCQRCGADLNAGRCACDKINQAHPFSALKDLKF